jgi:MscS family membrane protein
MTVWDAEGTGTIDFDAGEMDLPMLGTIVENRLITAALAQRVQEQLEPLLRERSLSIRWQQTQDRLLGWWQADLLVVDDQSVRVREGVIALVVFCAVVAGIWIFKLLLRRGLARRQPRAQAEQQGGIRLLLSAVSRHTTQLFILVLAFYVAMEVSGLAGAKLESWLRTLRVLALYLQIGLWVNAAVVDYFTRRRSRLQQQDPSAATGYGLLLFFLRVGVWIVVIVSALAYFNYPIAGLIGALGVGGIAVGLAVQNILGDVFSSMAIVLDKPVRVGDFIKAGETLGTVEHIGVKTTRIRSLSGEQIVLSNTDLLNSRVHNFKRFEERRIVFQIGVIYQTPRNDLERIADMLKAAVEEQEQTRFDRAHFTEFGAFSLDFEVVYFVLSPDFALYRDIQQAINFSIHRRFEEAGIEFAYPTQELILRRGSSLAR